MSQPPSPTALPDQTRSGNLPPAPSHPPAEGSAKIKSDSGSQYLPSHSDSPPQSIAAGPPPPAMHYAGAGRKPGRFWPAVRRKLKLPFAEFLGTFALIMFGCGSVAQVVLSNETKGAYLSINFGWGIGVMIGVYIAAVSGAHLNPAVTLTLCLFRRFPWKNLLPYAFAQFLGAFCAAGVVYGNYLSAINVFEGGSSIRTVPGYSTTATAGIFCTYPAPHMTRFGMVASEFIATALLLIAILAITDPRNAAAAPSIPLALCFVLIGIGAAFGWETGYAINFARDFGPRLMSYCLGYGPEVWRAGGYYFWIPMVVPFLGGAFGGWLYDVLIFDGDSPVNEEWMGIRRLVPAGKEKAAPELPV